MVIKITRWLLMLVAGASACAVSLLAWMALSFGGSVWGIAGVAGVALPMLCFPLFALFLFRQKAGFYVFLLYFLLDWTLQILIAAPRLLFNPIASGMDRLIVLCLCCLAMSFGLHRVSARSVDSENACSEP
jgi:hypothetical protein